MPAADETALRPGSPSTPPAGADVVERLKALEQLARQIDLTRAAGRKLRLLVLLLMALVVLGVGARIYGTYNRIHGNAPAFQAAFAEEMGRLAPKAAFSLRNAIVEVAPDFQKAVQNDWQKNGPKIVAELDNHLNAFSTNCAANIKKGLETEAAGIVADANKQFAAAFPQLKDEAVQSKVFESIRNAMTVATIAIVEKGMNDTLDLVISIHEETLQFLPDKASQNRMKNVTGKLLDTLAKSLSKPAAKAIR